MKINKELPDIFLDIYARYPEAVQAAEALEVGEVISIEFDELELPELKTEMQRAWNAFFRLKNKDGKKIYKVRQLVKLKKVLIRREIAGNCYRNRNGRGVGKKQQS